MSSMTGVVGARIGVVREGKMFRLSFNPEPALLDRVRGLPFAEFDGVNSWTCQVCAQSVEMLRQWYYEGLVAQSVDDLLDDGEDLEAISPAILRQGTAKRPYQVVMSMRDDMLYNRLRSIAGASWGKASAGRRGAMTYPPGARAALGELVSEGTLSDPGNMLNPSAIMVIFDSRTGLFVVTGDERAMASFNRNFPTNDVVATWRGRGVDVSFADAMTEEVYRGELARASGEVTVAGFRAELWPHQTESVAVALERSGFGVFHQMGVGKGLVHGTPVLTPTGWVPVESLDVGDQVIGSGGKPVVVTGVFPRGELDVFKVSFNDRTSVTVDGEHLWCIQRTQYRSSAPERWEVQETRLLVDDLVDSSGNLKWTIPVVRPVEFAPAGDLPIDPYLLGVLLGAGTLDTDAMVGISSADSFILDEVRARVPDGMAINKVSKSSEYDYSIVNAVRGGANPLREKLNELGLRSGSWEKRIPEVYLRASVEDRLALLRGLMDTDGHASTYNGVSEYSSTSKDLSDGVADLVQGLGGVARRSTNRPPDGARLAYRVYVKLAECPFMLPRKVEAWRKPTKYLPNRCIKMVEPAGRAEVTCISVDAKDSLYVVENCVVTHNTVVALAMGHELLFNRGGITRVVVVVPGSIRTQWSKEIARFSDGKVVVVDGPLKNRVAAYEAAADAQWLIVHYDVVHRDIKYLTPLVSGALLIADEAHRLKNHTAKRTKAMRTLAGRAGRRLALTGTPVLNDPGEWHSIISGFVEPGCFGSPIDFLNRYAYKNSWGGYEGARNLTELSQRSATYYTRYTMAEVAAHMPPLRIKPETLDVDPAYRAALNRAHREARAEIRDEAVKRAVATGRIGILDGDLRDEVETGAEMTAVGMLRLLCLSPRVVQSSDSAAAQALFDAGLLPDEDGPKVDKLLDIAEECAANGSRVVVFSSSKRMVYLLAERLSAAKISYVCYTGDTNRTERDAAVEAFTAPPTEDNPGPTVFLATDAGGEGLNLGAQCSLLVNMDIPWTPGALAQRSSRIHRIDGTADHYLVINLILKGTIEEGIMRMVENKADMVDAILGERGGRAATTGRGGRSIFEEALEEWFDGE